MSTCEQLWSIVQFLKENWIALLALLVSIWAPIYQMRKERREHEQQYLLEHRYEILTAFYKINSLLMRAKSLSSDADRDEYFRDRALTHADICHQIARSLAKPSKMQKSEMLEIYKASSLWRSQVLDDILMQVQDQIAKIELKVKPEVAEVFREVYLEGRNNQ